MKYDKKEYWSYVEGSFGTFELLLKKPEQAEKVVLSSNTNLTEDMQKLIKLCEEKNVPYEVNQKLLDKLTNKGNVYVVAIFKKYESKITSGNHIVLVNPSDMGNLGTIIRAMNGFDIKNLAIITPCADLFNPKTVRASMGSLFNINFSFYGSFDDYKKEFAGNKCMMFCLDGKNTLQTYQFDRQTNYSLVFGNEATGLSDAVKMQGEGLFISHTKNIDSLNLSISATIAVYEFTKQLNK